jgi:phosphohistidine phosphatase
MRQLLLLRHAKSSWDEPKMADRDRPLSARGRRAAAGIRSAMRELGLVPDLVLVSPARRTRETLAALEPWDDTPLVETLEPLYLAGAPQLLATLRDVAETVRSVLLIGHNPGLHELAVTLVGAQAMTLPSPSVRAITQQLAAGYPTGALAEFAVASPWRGLDAGGGRLIHFLNPRDLPEMAV